MANDPNRYLIYEQYQEAMWRFATPEEVEEILRRFGSARQLLDRIDETEEMLAQWRFRKRVRRVAKEWLTVAGIVITALAGATAVYVGISGLP